MSAGQPTTAALPLARRQNAICPGLAGVAGGLALLAYSQFCCYTPPDKLALIPLLVTRAAGLLLSTAGVVLLFGGELPWFRHTPLPAAQFPAAGRLRVIALLAGLALSALAGPLAGTHPQAAHPAASLLAWLAGIVLVVWAGWQGPFTPARDTRWFWLLGGNIFVAALLLRLISLQTIPVIFTGDESGFGRVAQQILRGEISNPFTAPYMGGTNLPYLYDLLQAGALAMFGRSAFALRLTSALAGALTVLALFYFARRWFDRRSAVFAALLLLGSHLHLHFSRYAISNVFDGLFFVLVTGLLWDAWDSGEGKKYLLAGLALGFSQYFYTSARTLPLAALAFFAAAFLIDRERFKAARVSILFFWAAFLVVFLPMILYYLQVPYTFIAPWSRVGQEAVREGGLLSAFNLANLPATLSQVYQGLLGFTVLPLKWLYRPGVAILRPLPAMLFLCGAAALLARRRWSQILLLALWLAAFGIIGGLSDATPAAQRYVAAVPALALLAGYGLTTAVDLLERYRPALARAALLLAVVVALFAGLDDARFYFFQYTRIERYADPNGLGVQVLADYLQTKDANTQVIFAGYPGMEYTSIPTLGFFNPHIRNVVSLKSPQELDAVLDPPSVPRVYFFSMGLQDDLRRVTRALPGGRLTSESNTFGEPVYWIYDLAP